MAREPFTDHQLDYIERKAGDVALVWYRASEHLKRAGAENTELARLIRVAEQAEHALKMHLFHKRFAAQRKGLR